MTTSEFVSSMKSYGIMLASAASDQSITIANMTLQNIKAAMLPKFLIDLYKQHSALNLGTGYIFGPTEIKRNNRYPIPSIVQINERLKNFSYLRGKTIFGRNDLFWFGFDSFGNCFMLDNITLKELRKYDDPYKALTDCLLGGKI